jgi:TetR/AcrR family tetracycline transcriptional repressor
MERPPLGPKALQLAERVLDVLCQAGLDRPGTARAYETLLTYVCGFGLRQSAAANGFARLLPGADPQQALAAVGAYVGSLPRDQFPNLVTLAGDLTDPDVDGRFQFGLDLLIKGLTQDPRDQASC